MMVRYFIRYIISLLKKKIKIETFEAFRQKILVINGSHSLSKYLFSENHSRWKLYTKKKLKLNKITQKIFCGYVIMERLRLDFT